jgi:hypothetical protein
VLTIGIQVPGTKTERSFRAGYTAERQVKVWDERLITKLENLLILLTGDDLVVVKVRDIQAEAWIGRDGKAHSRPVITAADLTFPTLESAA